MATGTFYIYFKKKEDIVTAIPRPEFLHLPEIVNGNAGADTRERLEDYSVRFLSIIEESGIGLCREWVRSYISGEPMDGSEGDTKWEFDLAAVRRVLEEGVRRGEIPVDAPIDEIALAVNAGLYGLMVAWCMSDGKMVGSERAPALLDMVLPGLLGTPGR